jgi:hypothetical protein
LENLDVVELGSPPSEASHLYAAARHKGDMPAFHAQWSVIKQLKTICRQYGPEDNFGFEACESCPNTTAVPPSEWVEFKRAELAI